MAGRVDAERGLPTAEGRLVADAAPRTGAGLGRLLTNPYLTLVSRLVLGVIFFLAGLVKLGIPDSMAASINSYEMPLPKLLVDAMAVGLPPVEMGLGLFLLLGLFLRPMAILSGALNIIFLIAMIQAAARGLSPDCGCFAGAQDTPVGQAILKAFPPFAAFMNEPVGVGSILRDTVFLLMSVHLFLVPTIFGLDNWRHAHQAALRDEEDDAEAEEEDTETAQ
jgi:uncharacterized membrane protein YphA (DoxX/SURF4 family)